MSSIGSNHQTVYSLYIPTIKITHTEADIRELVNLHNIGYVTRVDFAPIVIPGTENDLVPQENTKFRKAFIHLKGMRFGFESIHKSIEENGSYRFYPYRRYSLITLSKSEINEYWILLKNNDPVPESTTKLNVHQLAHNISLLETRLAEMEKEMEKLKQQNIVLEDKNSTLTSMLDEKQHFANFKENIDEYLANECKKYCYECNSVELTGYAEIVCPSCLDQKMKEMNPSHCDLCNVAEVSNGNYICEECFYKGDRDVEETSRYNEIINCSQVDVDSILDLSNNDHNDQVEVSGIYDLDNNSEDLDSGERSPRFCESDSEDEYEMSH
jgi:hypothetical protein